MLLNKSLRQAVYGLILRSLFLGLVVGAAGARAAQSPPTAHIEVHYQDNTLTVNLQDAPLRAVLQAISQQTGVQFHGIIQEAPVSVMFHNLPLEQAITRLLRGQNFAALYTHTKPQQSTAAPKTRLTAVWLLSEGEQTVHASRQDAEGTASAESTGTPQTPAEAFRQVLQRAQRQQDKESTSDHEDVAQAFRDAFLEAQSPHSETESPPGGLSPAVQVFRDALERAQQQELEPHPSSPGNVFQQPNEAAQEPPASRPFQPR